MDPNQQPNQPQQPPQELQPPYPPQGQAPITASIPATPAPQQPPTPQAPSTYSAAPVPSYDPNYLDSIAPPPPPPKFFSGSFSKIFFGLMGLLFIAVSLIIAFSGKDPSVDLQQVSVRLDNFAKTTKVIQKNLKSNKLADTNTEFQIWLTGNQATAEKLLKDGGIQKAKYSKTMVAAEAKITTDLDAKFEDARLNARLDRVYANTMASETQKMTNLLNSMAKKSKTATLRNFAKTASDNLASIHKSFEEYNDDGN